MMKKYIVKFTHPNYAPKYYRGLAELGWHNRHYNVNPLCVGSWSYDFYDATKLTKDQAVYLMVRLDVGIHTLPPAKYEIIEAKAFRSIDDG